MRTNDVLTTLSPNCVVRLKQVALYSPHHSRNSATRPIRQQGGTYDHLPNATGRRAFCLSDDGVLTVDNFGTFASDMRTTGYGSPVWVGWKPGRYRPYDNSCHHG